MTNQKTKPLSPTTNLFHREYGAGPALTILHGLLGSGGNWHTLARSVFANTRRVIVPDLRNHGQSPHLDAMSYPLMADDVEDVWDQLGVYESDLIGHSMGGKVAMELALTSPDRVPRVVVVDIAPKSYEGRHLDLFSSLRRVDPTRYGSRLGVQEALGEEISSGPVLQFLMKNLRRTGSNSFEWQVNLDAIEANYQALASGIEAFATYPSPALFIRGGRSDYVQDEDLEIIRAYFPSAEVVTISEASHWVHAEAKEEFASVVSEFLGS